MLNIYNLRNAYKFNVLKRKDLPENPIHLFTKWLSEAIKLNLLEPTAMCLSTVDKNGQPYQRTVLLKYFNDKEMIFFTNIKSRKGLQLKKNPKVSLLFYWKELERQIMILGNVTKLSYLITKKYFYSRPKDSQISALISKQSKKIDNRKIMEKKFIKLKKKFINNDKLPVPNVWRGYKVKINVIEFWQGRENRMHDRFLYEYKNFNWNIDRLFP